MIAGTGDAVWSKSAGAIREVLDAEARRLHARVRAWSPPALREVDVPTCVIVHEGSQSEPELLRFLDTFSHSCAVVVTGAATVFSGTLSALRAHPRIVGMPLVYGREGHFSSWFDAWFRVHLSLEGFHAVRQELINPTKHTAAAAARRLLPALSRLHTTLTGYVSALGRVVNDDDRSRLREWLKEGLRSWVVEAAPDLQQDDIHLVLREIRRTGDGKHAWNCLQLLSETARATETLAIEDLDCVRNFALQIDEQREWLASFAGEADHGVRAATVRVTPLDLISDLRDAILDLAASIRSRQRLSSEAEGLLFSEHSRQVLALIITSIVPPYDTRKRLVRLLDPNHSAELAQLFRDGKSSEGGARAAFDSIRSETAVIRSFDSISECRVIAADLRLLHWLAKTGAFEDAVSMVTHGFKSASRSLLALREKPVEMDLDNYHRLMARVGGAFARSLEPFNDLVSQFGPEFGLIPSAAFHREHADARRLISEIAQRLERIRELEAQQLRSIEADVWQLQTFVNEFSKGSMFEAMFDSFASELLKERHDARS